MLMGSHLPFTIADLINDKFNQRFVARIKFYTTSCWREKCERVTVSRGREREICFGSDRPVQLPRIVLTSHLIFINFMMVIKSIKISGEMRNRKQHTQKQPNFNAFHPSILSSRLCHTHTGAALAPLL
jgi:hypothetical protein